MNILSKLLVYTVASLLTLINNQLIAAPVSFRVGLQVPLDHHLAKSMALFKQELEEKSGGQLQIKLHDYASLKEEKEKAIDTASVSTFYKDKEMINAVSNGLVELGLVSLTRFSETIPEVDIFFQPFLFDTEKKINKARSKGSLIRETLEKEINKTGNTVLWWQSYGNSIMVSKAKGIITPDDMRGKNVRVFGETLGNLALVAGGIPVLIPNSRQYFSYKYGKAEIGMTTIADLAKNRIWEVMDTVSITNHASIQFVTIANTRWLNSLRNDMKSIILNASSKVEDIAEADFRVLEKNSYKAALQNGMIISVLSDDDREFWKEKSSPLYKKYLENTGNAGQVLFDQATNF